MGHSLRPGEVPPAVFAATVVFAWEGPRNTASESPVMLRRNARRLIRIIALFAPLFSFFRKVVDSFYAQV
jgi:hypothetical protein